MSQIPRIKSVTADKAFQGQCFMWKRGAFVGADFGLLTFRAPCRSKSQTL